MTPDPYSLVLLAVCVWREARGQSIAAKQAVAWVVNNRALNPGWWGGPSIPSVVLQPWQFSSFNSGDPNAIKWPMPSDQTWIDSLNVATGVLGGTLDDVTSGATSYYDDSIPPPSWATDGSNVETISIDGLNFYRLAQGHSS